MILLKSDKRRIAKEETLDYFEGISTFYNRYKRDFRAETVDFLNKLGKAITGNDIDYLFEFGTLPRETIVRLEQIIEQFAERAIDPVTRAAAEEFFNSVARKEPTFDPSTADIATFNQVNRKAFSEMILQSQVGGLSTVMAYIKDNDRLESLRQSELKQVVKQSAGLDSNRIKSSLNNYATQRENGVKREQALKNNKRLTERQLKARAETIVSDGILNTYRETEYLTVKELERQNVIEDPVMRWSTSRDDRVCSVCRELEGQVVSVNSYFRTQDGQVFEGIKGAHPNCRCTRVYIDRELYELGIAA